MNPPERVSVLNPKLQPHVKCLLFWNPWAWLSFKHKDPESKTIARLGSKQLDGRESFCTWGGPETALHSEAQGMDKKLCLDPAWSLSPHPWASSSAAGVLSGSSSLKMFSAWKKKQEPHNVQELVEQLSFMLQMLDCTESCSLASTLLRSLRHVQNDFFQSSSDFMLQSYRPFLSFKSPFNIPKFTH